MDEIPFPNRYKKALKSRSKNTTIRFGAEVGKYQVGKVYQAKSYADRSWNIKIKILEVIPTTVSNLEKFAIPKQTIHSFQKKATLNTKVEIIRFCFE